MNYFTRRRLAKQNQYAFLKTARNEGRAEARAEEAQKARKNTEMSIRRLLSDNRYSVSEISEIIGWSPESIQEIKDSILKTALRKNTQ